MKGFNHVYNLSQGPQIWFDPRVCRTEGMLIKACRLEFLKQFLVAQKDVAKITVAVSLWHQPDLGFNSQFYHLICDFGKILQPFC